MNPMRRLSRLVLGVSVVVSLHASCSGGPGYFVTRAQRGAWRVESLEGVFQDGGPRQRLRLVRRGVVRSTEVDGWLTDFVFTGEDCVVYGRRPMGTTQVWCACGDREPAFVTDDFRPDPPNKALTIDETGVWWLDAREPLAKGVLERYLRVPMASIVEAAERQPRRSGSHREMDMDVDGATRSLRAESFERRVDTPEAINRSRDERTLLETAVLTVRPDLVAALIRGGANVDLQSPLLVASGHSSSEILSALLAAGASVEAATPKGVTALMIAARECRGENVRLSLGLRPGRASHVHRDSSPNRGSARRRSGCLRALLPCLSRHRSVRRHRVTVHEVSHCPVVRSHRSVHSAP